jgi:hypothetical protein
MLLGQVIQYIYIFFLNKTDIHRNVCANNLTSSATCCQMNNFYPFLLMSHNNIRNPPNLCVVCYGRNIR